MGQFEVVEWIHQNYHYPHCLKVNSLSSLKNGVALAQIISDCLPETYHPLFLPYIQLSALSLDKSISNLKTVLASLTIYIHNNSLPWNLKSYSPEGLYYRQPEMLGLMQEVVIPLAQWSIQNKDRIQPLVSYPSTVAAHSFPLQNANNISQLSDIVNLSNLVQKPQPKNDEQQYQQQEDGHSEHQEHFNEENMISQQIMYVLENWLREKLKNEDLCEPEYVFGQIINHIFCNSRFKDPIIKQAHFLQGSISIYRKGLNFLLTNQLADRFPKENALNLMRTLEDNGIIRQTQYWMLIKDLFNFQQAKSGIKGKKVKVFEGSKLERKNEAQCDNIIINRQPSYRKNLPTCKSSKKTLVQCKSSVLFNYSAPHLCAAEKWISKDLGYEHSLNKGRNLIKQEQFLLNPLFNGALIGSIVMRIKIGRPRIIKQPTTMKQVQKNWKQINKICVLRGYQCFRKQSLISDHKFNVYLGLAGDLKNEYEKRQGTKNKQNVGKNCNMCEHELIKKKQRQFCGQKKEEIKSWLQEKYNIYELSKKGISVQNMNQVCGQLLGLNLYRQTTSQIQKRNVAKILQELRRVGLSHYYGMSEEKVLDDFGDSVRWRVLEDVKWLLEEKVQYCHN